MGILHKLRPVIPMLPQHGYKYSFNNMLASTKRYDYKDWLLYVLVRI